MKVQMVYRAYRPATLLEFLLEQVNGQSRNSVKHMLSRGQVLVDGTPQRQFDLALAPGQTVTILPQAQGAALPFPVLYEDDQLLVIDKPAGLLSVATDTQSRRTAYRIAADYVRARDPRQRLLVVHRLDRDTSGVLLFAKDPALRNALQDRWNTLVKQREYCAIVEGDDLPDSGVCHSRLTQNRAYKVYSAPEGGKDSVTRYTVLARHRGYSLLRVELDTGRKNQIRAHLSELGYPVAGDGKYGAATDPFHRLALHAGRLSLTHPVTGKVLTFTAPLPGEFTRLFPGQFPVSNRKMDIM